MLGSRSALPKMAETNCPLFHANTARRRAEQDSILLANRIRLLRLEEEKARKKIRETEQKTKEIIEVRRRGEEKRSNRYAEEARREAYEQELRAKAARDRQEQQRKTQLAQREIIDEKVHMHMQETQTKRIHKLAIQQEQQEAAAEVRARAAQVRKDLAAGERRRARSEGARIEAGRAIFQEKLVREEEARHESLEQICRMEKEEADLIQRLQRTQERHRVAYAQLQDVLEGGGSAGTSTSSRCPSSLQDPSDSLQVATTSASRLPMISTGCSGESTESRPLASRPPRPRIAAAPTPTGASRSSVSTLRRARSQSPQTGRPCSGGGGKNTGGGGRNNSATSICSTASDGPRPESAGSAQSTTPCSPSNAPITYTTVDGLQIDIPPEDDLDLGKLLCG